MGKTMKRWIAAAMVLLGLAVATPAAAGPFRPYEPWRVTPTWADEFNGAAGTAPNPNKWKVEEIDLGDHEQQTYVNDRRTAAHDGAGNMVLTAIRETSASGRPYKSGRLSSGFSRSPFFSTYGRWEARMKIPAGQGVWPAFWGLGDWNAVQHWPRVGEIDVMESINSGSVTHGGIHTVAASDNSSHRNFGGQSARHPSGSWANGWHVWRIDWDSNGITWSIDGAAWQTVSRATVTAAGAKWLFDGTRPQAPILNLAVGGDWAGPASGWTSQRFLIDYVRIWTPRPEGVRKW
jgi:beta-glucanase (GH16 family)